MALSPALLIILAFVAFPFAWAILLTFTDKVIGAKANIVGLENYIVLMKDSIFRRSFANSLYYTVVTVFFKVAIGIVMALVLNQPIKGRGVFRGLLLLPWVIPTLVTGLTWQWILSDVSGALNIILRGLGLIDRNIAWLADPNTAMPAVMLVNIWRGFPFIGVTVLAGLQGVPASLYEAAALDGADSIRRFIHVTLPSLRNVLSISALLTTIWTLNDFELVYLLTKGGPMHRTELFSILTYQYGFSAQKLGLGTTVSMIALPLSLFLMVAVIRSINRSEGEA